MAKGSRLKNQGKRSYGKDADKPEKSQGKRSYGKKDRKPRGNRGY